MILRCTPLHQPCYRHLLMLTVIQSKSGSTPSFYLYIPKYIYMLVRGHKLVRRRWTALSARGNLHFSSFLMG